jgi:hypothetical protein
MVIVLNVLSKNPGKGVSWIGSETAGATGISNICRIEEIAYLQKNCTGMDFVPIC